MCRLAAFPTPVSSDPFRLRPHARRLAERGHGERRVQPAGLGRVDGDQVDGVGDAEVVDVTGGPGALVGHHRDVAARRHLGELLGAVAGLLDPEDVEGLQAPDLAERGLRVDPGRVRVDVDADLVASDPAQPVEHLGVPRPVRADLDLEVADAVGERRLALLHGLLRRQVEAEAGRDLDRVAPLAAEQRVHRQAGGLAHQVITGDVDRGLRVEVALDDLLHAVVDGADVERVHADDRRRDQIPDQVRGGLRRLPVVAPVVPSPLRGHRRLAEALGAVVARHPDQDRTPDLRDARRPAVVAPGREGDAEGLDRGDLHLDCSRFLRRRPVRRPTIQNTVRLYHMEGSSRA